MKKIITASILAFIVAFGFYAVGVNAQMGSGMMGQGGRMGQAFPIFNCEHLP